MKRALITGIGGFVGSHLLGHIMKNTDWEVVGIDSFRHQGKTDRITDLLATYPEYSERITIVTHDLKAPISTQMDLAIGHIDYVFNIASESHVDRSISDPRPFIENNVGLVLTMLEWLRTRPEVRMFIQCSTDEVYGPTIDHDHTEGEPHRPSNPYAASKSAQEQICYSYWRTYGLPIIITNCMNMFGELQDPEKYIPMIISHVLNDNPVTAHVSPTGVPGSRYYLHARNMCDAMLFIVNSLPATRYPAQDIDRYNIVSDDEINNINLANIIARMLNKPVQIETQNFHESRPGHDLRYGLSNKKLTYLGWSPPLDFETSMQKTVDWYRNHPEWLL